MTVTVHQYSAIAILLVAGGLSSVASAQVPAEGPVARPQSKARYANHDACVTCHFPKPGVQGIASSSLDFVQTTPATVWEHEDKHRQAFSLLLQDENKSIVESMLGFDLRAVVQNGEVLADKLDESQHARLQQCLRCHAARPMDDTSPVLSLDLGVSCQACHGPGFQWFQAHQEDKVWRLVSPDAKERLHMTDVRSPITRAKLCASCHIGDLQQGRMVTHEMYAQGHPPLPSFELESFAGQMPPHWRRLPEKPDFELWASQPAGFDRKVTDWLERYPAVAKTDLLANYRQANFDSTHDPRQDLSLTRGMVVAGAIELQSYLNLLAMLTSSKEKGAHAWPEFASFDCTACHHELQTELQPSKRPAWHSPPGRPPMPIWPSVLVRVGIVQLAKDSTDAEKKLASFDQRLRALEAAVIRQPFGNPRDIRPLAAEMSRILDTLAEQLARSRFDQAAAKRLLQFLTDPEQHAVHDYHSARQIAWAIRQIVKDLHPNDDTAAKLFARKNGDNPLSLNLPAGQQKSVVRNLASSLDAIAKYDPGWFSAELKSIRESLKLD